MDDDYDDYDDDDNDNAKDARLRLLDKIYSHLNPSRNKTFLSSAKASSFLKSNRLFEITAESGDIFNWL